MQDEEAFRTVDTRTLDLIGTAIATVRLGEIEVTDGKFTVALDDVPGEAWAFIRRLRLRDPNALEPELVPLDLFISNLIDMFVAAVTAPISEKTRVALETR